MQLGYTILYVPDVPATLKFYEEAFGLATLFLHEGGDYGELETGSTVLAFSAHSLMQQLGKNPQAANAHAPCFEIALCTPDVAAALERALAAGATPMRALEVMPWGQTIAYVADINGFWWSFAHLWAEQIARAGLRSCAALHRAAQACYHPVLAHPGL